MVGLEEEGGGEGLELGWWSLPLQYASGLTWGVPSMVWGFGCIHSHPQVPWQVSLSKIWPCDLLLRRPPNPAQTLSKGLESLTQQHILIWGWSEWRAQRP